MTKAGTVPAATFSGAPATASVVFGTPFPDLAFALTADAVTQNGVVYEVAIENKTAAGFVLNLGSGDKTDLVEVGWQAIQSVS